MRALSSAFPCHVIRHPSEGLGDVLQTWLVRCFYHLATILQPFPKPPAKSRLWIWDGLASFRLQRCQCFRVHHMSDRSQKESIKILQNTCELVIFLTSVSPVSLMFQVKAKFWSLRISKGQILLFLISSLPCTGDFSSTRTRWLVVASWGERSEPLRVAVNRICWAQLCNPMFFNWTFSKAKMMQQQPPWRSGGCDQTYFYCGTTADEMPRTLFLITVSIQ